MENKQFESGFEKCNAVDWGELEKSKDGGDREYKEFDLAVVEDLCWRVMSRTCFQKGLLF